MYSHIPICKLTIVSVVQHICAAFVLLHGPFLQMHHDILNKGAADRLIIMSNFYLAGFGWLAGAVFMSYGMDGRDATLNQTEKFQQLSNRLQ